MYETDGNIAVSCHNGRTRSAIYLVAYLMAAYNMDANEAKVSVAKCLQQQRGLELDRHGMYEECLSLIF